MNFTPLKHLLLIENITCVFRNYFFLKKRTRTFVRVWACIEIFLLIVNLVLFMRTHDKIHLSAESLYLVSVGGFSIYIFITSLYYARTFYELLCNFDVFHNIFADGIYTRIMLKAQKRLTIIVVTFSIVQILVFIFIRIVTAVTGTVNSSLGLYSASLSDFRYICQYFTLDGILFVISEQLKVITRSIDKSISVVRTERNMEHGRLVSSLSTVDQDRLKKINKWMKIYENINYSCNLCNAMYSVQLTIMIMIVTIYCTMSLYSIARITVEGVPTPHTLFSNIFSMVVFLMLLFIIFCAGQRVQNNSNKLRQRLCELCIHSLGNEQYYKLSRDLLRYVRTRSVRLHVFGSQDVNLSKLPTIVGVITTYTVIALQFNNVV